MTVTTYAVWSYLTNPGQQLISRPSPVRITGADDRFWPNGQGRDIGTSFAVPDATGLYKFALDDQVPVNVTEPDGTTWVCFVNSTAQGFVGPSHPDGRGGFYYLLTEVFASGQTIPTIAVSTTAAAASASAAASSATAAASSASSAAGSASSAASSLAAVESLQITAAATQTGPAGSAPTATMSGTFPNLTLTLNDTLGATGATGATGQTGATGPQGIPGELIPEQSVSPGATLDVSAYGATPVRLYVTLTANLTVQNIPAAPAAGFNSLVELVFIQTGTNAFTVTYSGDVRWAYASTGTPAGVAHVMSAGISATAPASIFDRVMLIRSASYTWAEGVVADQLVKFS